MFGTILIAIIIVAAIGLAYKWILEHSNSPYRDDTYHISWPEFVVGILAVAIIVAPLVTLIGNKLSVAQALRYQEFYNGIETEAVRDITECYAGHAGNSASSGQSNCTYVYDSGDYTYTDLCPETRYYTDADGNTRSETVWVPCTKWADIYTPYATEEHAYAINDSLGGTHRFGGVYLAADPTPYDRHVAIPGDIPRGAPTEWTAAKQRLDAGDPRAVTRLFGYDNYILAAGEEMLLPYSQDVDRYLEADLLPDHTASILTDPLGGFNNSFASKVSFVGIDVGDEQAWQTSAMRFNAALGSKLRGDLHMVIIDSTLIGNPENYLNALKAYWLGDHFGRRAIAKNAIIVVIGASDGRVDWARATTGMPFGNEVMIQHIQDFMPGTPLMPGRVLGKPRTVIVPATSNDDDDEVQVTLADQRGVLEDIIFDLAPFERACMACTDDEGQVGYGNLVAKIKPPFWQQALMVAVIALLSMLLWRFVAAATLFGNASASRRRDEDVQDSPDYRPRYYPQDHPYRY